MGTSLFPPMGGHDTDELTARIEGAVRAASDADPGRILAALRAVGPDELGVFLHRSLDVPDGVTAIGSGLPASPGAASGAIVLSAESAMTAADTGAAVILVRTETTPDDVHGMLASRGILTSRGGLVSHAAVVARGWGIPAIVGAAGVVVDGDTVLVDGHRLREGDIITIDGTTGHIYTGELATTGADAPPELDTLLSWADDVACGHVQVRVNADTEGDAAHGRRRGARGIGLCRTEHMFLAADRLALMRRFILSDDVATETDALRALESAQVTDFETLLEAMDGLPVTIRLLDPPLHEFLPDLLDLVAREARGELTSDDDLELAAVRRLHETNPMIGTRGVRLGMVRSGLYEMQVRALCTAAARLFDRGLHPHVEIMIPLVVDAEELRIARGWVTGVLDTIGHPELASNVVTVGAMIETPRAALTAGALAEHADFFSFGTNDLTQMTYAFSRDDVEAKLLPLYLAHGILPANPFGVLDRDGVGQLVRLACDAARAAKPGIKLGVCGEHAGDPASVEFLVAVGVDSVSCSPYRVPMARLGVAQALLDTGRVDPTTVTFSAAPESTTSAPAPGFETSSVSADAGTSDVIDVGRVLHTLRIRGFVSPAGFEASLGVHPAEILEGLVESGQARYLEPRQLYGLLPPGKELLESLLSEFATPEVTAALHHDYDKFLALNAELKTLCTDWQMRAGEPNDHTDAAYDAGCVERLVALTDQTAPVVDAMASTLPRFRRYVDRLRAAVEQVLAGQHKRFTGVMCESYHDVWMELHEDLIVLQRIDRTVEGSF